MIRHRSEEASTPVSIVGSRLLDMLKSKTNLCSLQHLQRLISTIVSILESSTLESSENTFLNRGIRFRCYKIYLAELFVVPVARSLSDGNHGEKM